MVAPPARISMRMQFDTVGSVPLTPDGPPFRRYVMRNGGDPSILVVDDDPDILQTLALCLSTEGYAVLMASNGKEALELLRHEKPAIILLDLMMPVMDGWQFVSEIDQRGWRKAPILILSADRAVQG